jgi:hypothetical protein
MNINELLEEFFDNMYPNFCEEYVEENEVFELWKICDDFFQQMGQQV